MLWKLYLIAFSVELYGWWCTRLQCVTKAEILVVGSEEAVLQVGVNTDKTKYVNVFWTERNIKLHHGYRWQYFLKRGKAQTFGNKCDNQITIYDKVKSILK